MVTMPIRTLRLYLIVGVESNPTTFGSAFRPNPTNLTGWKTQKSGANGSGKLVAISRI